MPCREEIFAIGRLPAVKIGRKLRNSKRPPASRAPMSILLVHFMDWYHESTQTPGMACGMETGMQRFLAILAAVMAALPRYVWRAVTEAGKTVMRLFVEPPAPAPVPRVAPVAQAQDDHDSVKALAKTLLAGKQPSAEALGKMPEQTFKWLKALDRNGLAKVAVADVAVLRGHLRGGAPMRGLVPYDKAAIDDVTKARKPKTAARRRTLRDELEETLGVSLAA